MKKYYYYIAIIVSTLAVMACAKEIEQPNADQDNNTKVSIAGAINNNDSDDATKTDYSLSGTKYLFHWSGTKGDEKFSRLIQTTNIGSITYESDEDGGVGITSISFKGDAVPSNQTDLGYALYPKLANNDNTEGRYFGIWSSTSFHLQLQRSLVYHPDAPLANLVPMVGKLVNGEFQFNVVTGLIAIEMTGVPNTATKLTISAANDYLSGGFSYSANSFEANGTAETKRGYYLDQLSNIYQNGLQLSAYKSSTESYKDKSYTFSSLNPESTYVFYFPIPVGTIQGLTIALYDSNNTCLYLNTTSKNISSAKGHITKLPSITVPSYTVTIDGYATDPTIHMQTSSGNSIQFGITDSTTPPTSFDSNAKFTVIPSSWTISDSYKPTSSGLKYFHYRVYKTTDSKITRAAGYVPFYFLTATDRNSYAGQYQITFLNAANPTTLTLAASDNASKGNIILTEFAEHEGKMYGSYDPAASNVNLVFSNSYDSKFSVSENTQIYSGGTHHTNLRLYYDGRSNANYGNAIWDIICWNQNLLFETIGSTPTTYTYLRGNIIRDIFTVAGSPASVFGSEWDYSEAANNDMVYNPVTDLYSKSFTVPAGTTVSFKVFKDHNNAEAWPSANYDLAADSRYDRTITISIQGLSKAVSISSITYSSNYTLYVKQEKPSVATSTKWGSTRSVWSTRDFVQLPDDGDYKRFLIPIDIVNGTEQDLYYKGENGCEVKLTFTPSTETTDYYYKTNGFEIVEESDSYSTSSTRIWACMPLSWNRNELKMWVWGGSSLDTSGNYEWSNMRSMTLLSDTKYDNCQWFYIDVPASDQAKTFSWKFVWNNAAEGTQNVESKQPSSSLYFKLTGNNAAVEEITF